MSATSTKIYGNDMAMDVKEDFLQLYGIKMPLEEIHEYIFQSQPEDDDESACAYWSALALIEWEYGVLDEQIHKKAVSIITNNSDAELFIKQKDQLKRAKELENLLEKLNTVNPKPKKRKATFIYRCPYQVGDVIAFPLKDHYVYFHVVGIVRTKESIEALAEDNLYVKVFDVCSDELLDIKQFKPSLFHRIKYKKLPSYPAPTDTKLLWCVGKREQAAFEKKVIPIGSIPTPSQNLPSIVSADFQFQEIENTITELFGL